MISAESSILKVNYDTGIPKDPEVTYTFERVDAQRWLIVLRVFLEGSYEDPLGMEPTQQEYQKDLCHIL